jgi:predicted deacylase
VIERTTLTFERELLRGAALPCVVASGAEEGSRLALIAGIHGCEYSSIAAVMRFMSTLDTDRLRGTIVALPVVNLSSFRARSPFVTPEDGKNLNRCFPGSYDASYSDALARAVFDEVIAPSDALVDLHGGDLVEALEPFCLYDESAVEARGRELAIAFGLPYVVRSPREGGAVSGTTSSAAAAAGIPAVIAEAGGCGLLEESAVHLHLRGLENVLRHLGMAEGEASPPPQGMRSVDRFVWLRCEHEGWWEPAARAGDEVASGQPVGVVRNLYGDVLEEIVAPEAGVLLFVTSSPAVAADGLLLGFGTGLATIS